MGTRNLICIFYNGDYKVAQYGQWDGYPRGQGKRVLEFLQSTDIEEFKKKLELVRFATEEDLKEVDNFFKLIKSEDGWMTSEQADLYKKEFPLLSRDNGSKVLDMIMEIRNPVFLQNSIGFAGNSLFCEWGYVIDLDNNRFEVYKGFNKNKVTEGRFLSDDPDLEKTEKYEPIVMVKSYHLNNLPDLNQFYDDLLEKEEDE